jgi:acetyl-CoA carboxylase biotin carboxyl carrier protein
MKGSKNKKTTPSADLGIAGVDVPQLERLLDFMASHGLEEFEYHHGGTHIRLKKAPAGFYPAKRGASGSKAAPADPPAPAGEAVLQAASATGAEEAAPPAAAQAEELHIVKSPIVGTFYAAASPEAAAFVRIGDSVEAGQVVCIIEAMKLMNEIEADVAGEIARALVENGQPVEYGQGLFAIRPAKKKK